MKPDDWNFAGEFEIDLGADPWVRRILGVDVPLSHTDCKKKEKSTMTEASIKNVIFNPPATIVFWSDGTKTAVKCSEKDIFDLTTVKYAILETNGQLSTLLYGKDTPPTAKDLGVRVPEARLPVTLITGGKLLRDNLSLVGLSEQELSRRLESQGCTLKSTLLYTLDTAGHGYLIKREDMV